MKKNNEKLKVDLKSFGLNPYEWMIEEINKNIFRINHIADTNFTFIGQTIKENGQVKWQEIRLISV